MLQKTHVYCTSMHSAVNKNTSLFFKQCTKRWFPGDVILSQRTPQLDQTPSSCLYVPRSDLTTRNIISLPNFPRPPPQSHRLRRSVDYLCISCCISSARALFQSPTQHHSAAQPIAPSRGASLSSLPSKRGPQHYYIASPQSRTPRDCSQATLI